MIRPATPKTTAASVIAVRDFCRSRLRAASFSTAVEPCAADRNPGEMPPRRRLFARRHPAAAGAAMLEWTRIARVRASGGPGFLLRAGLLPQPRLGAPRPSRHRLRAGARRDRRARRRRRCPPADAGAARRRSDSRIADFDTLRRSPTSTARPARTIVDARRARRSTCWSRWRATSTPSSSSACFDDGVDRRATSTAFLDGADVYSTASTSSRSTRAARCSPPASAAASRP